MNIVGNVLMDMSGGLQNVQNQFLTFCAESTIILGHNLHNDLIALKLHHRNFIDVGLLNRTFDNHRHTPALGDIHGKYFGMRSKTQSGADPVESAKMIIDVATWMKDNRMLSPKRAQNVKVEGTEDQRKLFVHKIPNYIRPDEIAACFAPQPVVSNVKKSPTGTWAALLDFQTSNLAETLYESIPGNVGSDTKGRPQKTLYIPYPSEGSPYVEIKVQISA
eukprot:GHVL01024514.1.p1 GENE.GHVL01024514.1~~GHVL01024514.1.p1  ORF type:complete len:220 (+),score=34.87 GHVL01024514.1:1304-1963(+)